MPYTRDILHTRFVTHLPGFFPSVVRIERPEVGQTSSGEEQVTGFTVLYAGLNAAISPVTRLGEEWRNWRLEFVLEQVTHRIMLKGLFSEIKATDRLIDVQTGDIHNIVSRHLDSHRNITRLDTRIVRPQAVEGVS